MFHHKGGWFFGRLPDGTVRIVRTKDGTFDGVESFDASLNDPTRMFDPTHPNIAECHEVDADSWASIIAYVSGRGETSDMFQRAREFHRGTDPGPVSGSVGTEGPFAAGIGDPITTKFLARLADHFDDKAGERGPDDPMRLQLNPLWRKAWSDAARALDRLIRREVISTVDASEGPIIVFPNKSG